MFNKRAETTTEGAMWREHAADGSHLAVALTATFPAGRAAGDPSFPVAPAPDVRAAADFPAVFYLADLDGDNGFRLDGIDGGQFFPDSSGRSVSSAGDVNGDGFDDIIIGALFANPGGEAYVVFGRADGFAPGIDLAALDGTDGFRIDALDPFDHVGRSVSSAGDVNGDGFDDIIIGANDAGPGGRVYAGESYVVFGRADGFPASFNLAALDGENGFRIGGVRKKDGSGLSVSEAGDFNGDGFDDIIIAAPFADADGVQDKGEAYLVFGKADGFAADLDFRSLDGGDGVRFEGVDEGDGVRSVSGAGDVNGDGFGDVVIGAIGADPGGVYGAGSTYVVFGGTDGIPTSFDLASLDGSNGFRLDGIGQQDQSGYSVSSAGDINGDGFDDIIIGAKFADTSELFAGESYVVFGRADGFAPSLDLATLDGANGFRVGGVVGDDTLGVSVSDAGDVNGDGFDDIIIGATGVGRGDDFEVGASYVIFGKAGGFDATFDLTSLDGTNGFRIEGIDRADRSGQSVSSAGDVNGDGFDDVIIGADDADPDGELDAGESYVVFGRAPTEAVTRIGSAADQTIRGGDFDDTLKGLRGDDMLAGGGGRDRLKGGAGSDDFVLASLDTEDRDRILDFGGDDRIALDGDVFGLTEGALAPGRFVIGDTAQDASDRVIYDDATGRLFFDADGTGAQAQVLIATVTGVPVIAASDILVI